MHRQHAPDRTRTRLVNLTGDDVSLIDRMRGDRPDTRKVSWTRLPRAVALPCALVTSGDRHLSRLDAQNEHGSRLKGNVARVDAATQVHNLPEPVPGTAYVVSGEVAVVAWARGRTDVFIVTQGGELVQPVVP